MVASLGLNIVLVEDDDAIREPLITFFELEGYRVRAAASAEEGLELLRQPDSVTHLLLSDYQLPGQTGTWLIREARALGLLDRGVSVLFTAHPRPSDAGETRVLQKPLDLDDLLREVEDALLPVRAAELAIAREHLERPKEGDGIDLLLYISARSPASLRAVRRLRALLDRFETAGVGVTIVDLAAGPSADADADHIVFTPTLVRRMPAPRLSLLGFDDMRVLEEMLQEAGVPRKSPSPA